MSNDFGRTIRAFRNLGSDPGAVEIVDELAQLWVDVSRERVPVDTGQLQARIGVRQVSGSGVRGEAWVDADTPYAGFVEFGTRYVPPRPYFRAGEDAARQAAHQLGGRLGTELRRALVSGGVWNPRNLF